MGVHLCHGSSFHANAHCLVTRVHTRTCRVPYHTCTTHTSRVLSDSFFVKPIFSFLHSPRHPPPPFPHAVPRIALPALTKASSVWFLSFQTTPHVARYCSSSNQRTKLKISCCLSARDSPLSVIQKHDGR